MKLIVGLLFLAAFCPAELSAQSLPLDPTEEAEYVRIHNRITTELGRADTTGLSAILAAINQFVDTYPNSLLLSALTETKIKLLLETDGDCGDILDASQMLLGLDDSPDRTLFVADAVHISGCDADFASDLLRRYESFGTSTSADELARFYSLAVDALTASSDERAAYGTLAKGLNRLIIDYPDVACTRRVSLLLSKAGDVGIEVESDFPELAQRCTRSARQK